MSSRVTPGTSPAPGSTSRGTPTSTMSSARRCGVCMTASIVGSARRASSVESVAVSRTSQAMRTSGSSPSVTARPPTCLASSSARAWCGWRRRPRRTPAPASASAIPSATLPAPRTSTRRSSSDRAGCARRARPPPTRPTARAGRWRSRCGPRLPTSTAWRNTRDSACPLADLVLGELPRLAHLAEDLALADDHRVEAGRHAEEVRDRRVVVVRVQDARRIPRGRRPTIGEEVEDVRHRRVELRGVGVDLGAVARGEQHDLGEVLARPRATGAPWPGATGRHRHPFAQLDRRGAVVQADDDHRHERSKLPCFGLAAGTDHVEDAGIEGAAANRRPRWNARRPGSLPGPPTARPAGSRTRAHLVATSPSGSAARAGLRPFVPIVTTISPRRTTDMRVNEQFAGSSAEFTQIRRASPAANTAWLTVGHRRWR